MSKAVKSFALPHYANVHKQNPLWELYAVYKNEHHALIRDRWRQFLAGNFSHFNYLGSTKLHKTALTQSDFQGLLENGVHGFEYLYRQSRSTLHGRDQQKHQECSHCGYVDKKTVKRKINSNASAAG